MRIKTNLYGFIKIIILLIAGLAIFGQPVFALDKIEINFFYSNTCPYCAKEKIFLNDLEKKYPDININRYEISDQNNVKLLVDFYGRYQVAEKEKGLVPVTFIRDRYFLGYQDSIGKEMEKYIGVFTDSVEQTVFPNNSSDISQNEARDKISLPFFGEISLSKFSPLAMAVVLGGLDGFNACAMAALSFLLAVLIASGERKRVLLVGLTFILASGIMYFLFISAWLNIFLVVSNIKLISIIIGLMVIFFGALMLKEYIYGIVCRLCEINPSKQDFFSKIENKLFRKMEKLLKGDLPLVWLLLGVAIIAAGINLTELACSLGFPVAFTKNLINSGVSSLSYYFYILVYTIFYMLDDIIVFLIALLTLRITSVSEKYLKLVKLIAGAALIWLGLSTLLRI